MSRLTDVGRQLVTYPTGVLGRNRPWYFLNVLDIVNGTEALRTYTDAMDDVARDVFEGDPLAVAIRDVAVTNLGWIGSAAQLLDRLHRPAAERHAATLRGRQLDGMHRERAELPVAPDERVHRPADHVADHQPLQIACVRDRHVVEGHDQVA